jgi:hypothetical protein
MSDDAPRPVAGWYPNANGEQRYWDGEKWLDIPPPHATQPTAGPTRKKGERRTALIVASSVIVLVLLAGGVALTMWVNHAREVAAQEEREAERAADAERQRQQEADRAEARDDAEREARADAVPGIEESIRVMAEQHVAEELIEGPVLSVDCSPVDGGSTDDLTEQTTVFECFVANKDNGDGTMSGYTYGATMNWSTGKYTYGIGAP